MDVLREFLVGLGFKIDDAGWKKFTGAVSQATKEVAELGGEAVATATSVGIMVDRVAREYEDLYYVSQRTGTMVSGLKAGAYGFQQIGVEAGAARSMVESFAASMRTNPGLRGFANSVGANSGDSQADLIKVVTNLKKQLKGNYFVGSQIATQTWGLPEREFFQMWNNLDKLNDKMKEAKDIQNEAGVAADLNAPKFFAFANSVDKLWLRFGALKDRIAADFLPWAQEAVDKIDEITSNFNKYNKEHGGDPAKVGTIAASAIGAWGVKKILFGVGRKLFGGGAKSVAARAAAPLAAAGGGGALGQFAEALALAIPLLVATTKQIGNKNEGAYYTRDQQGNIVPTGKFERDLAESGGVGSDRPQIIQRNETTVNVQQQDSVEATAGAISGSLTRLYGDMVRQLGARY